MTAAFVAPYTARFGTPLMLDAIDDMLTIDPLQRSSIPGSTARMTRYIEWTLMSNDRDHSSGEQSRIVPLWT
jgi:hypothetical protein